MEFGVCRYTGLDKQGGVIRVHPGRQPVHHHVPNAFLDDMRVFVMSSQGMPVSHEKEALVFGLEFDPVLQHPVIVSKVQLSRGAHSRQDPHRVAGQDRAHRNPTIRVTRRSTPWMGGPMMAPRMPVASRARRMKNPKGSSRASCQAQGPGSRPTATLPPSSGGIGRRLSIMNTALISIPNNPMYCIGRPTQDWGPSCTPIRATTAQKSAITRFAPGPAAATIAMSRLG